MLCQEPLPALGALPTIGTVCGAHFDRASWFFEN